MNYTVDYTIDYTKNNTKNINENEYSEDMIDVEYDFVRTDNQSPLEESIDITYPTIPDFDLWDAIQVNIKIYKKV